MQAYSVVAVTLASGCMGMSVDASVGGWVRGWIGIWVGGTVVEWMGLCVNLLRVGECIIDMISVDA